jgi:hypothetical protein
MTTPIRTPAGLPVPDCANGLHVAKLGSPCVCGDTGPTLRPRTKIVLGPERKLTYTAPH